MQTRPIKKSNSLEGTGIFIKHTMQIKLCLLVHTEKLLIFTQRQSSYSAFYFLSEGKGEGLLWFYDFLKGPFASPLFMISSKKVVKK